MALTQHQQKLIDDTRMRLEYLTKDCRTFFKVRHDHKDWFHSDHGNRPIGGGNFLTGIGLLSALNFAAKVYLHLTRPDAFVTAEDREAVEDARDKLKTSEDFKGLLKGHTNWRPPRVGDCNEELAFAKLSQAMKPTVDLGLTNIEEAKEVWRLFRNALAHMAWPQGMMLVLQSEQSSEQAELRLHGIKIFWHEDGPPTVGHPGNRWRFNVDGLLLQMDGIVGWLSEEIKRCPYPERVEAAVKWMMAT